MCTMSVDPTRLKILVYPAPALRKKGRQVDPADGTVRAVARRMIELMHEADGVGLAAPQVGLDWRLFVTNGREADPQDRVFINPELTLGRGEMVTEEEGCLSLPGINVQVRRAPKADIAAIDLNGEAFRMSADGLLTRIWQHENDHLDGVLIIDKMSPIDRLSTRKALKELKSAAAARGPHAL
jgi:peptide deformylase